MVLVLCSELLEFGAPSRCTSLESRLARSVPHCPRRKTSWAFYIVLLCAALLQPFNPLIVTVPGLRMPVTQAPVGHHGGTAESIGGSLAHLVFSDARAYRLFFQSRNALRSFTELLRRAIQVEALPESWRTYFQARIRKVHKDLMA